MITLKQWMETVNYCVTEGSEYTWTCFGPNAYSLDSWSSTKDHTFHIVFDTHTQQVYQVEAHDYKNRRSYRMINPEHIDAYNQSVKDRNINDVAYDDVKFIDLEIDEDWLDKAQAIFHGIDYDTRVRLPIDFSDQELLTHMKAAHEMDITFNQYVAQALTAAIDQYQMLKE